MSPPFFLNKEELNKCVYAFDWSARQCATNRPTNQRGGAVLWGWRSHKFVADDLHIVASVRINECSHIGQIAQRLVVETARFVRVDDVH